MNDQAPQTSVTKLFDDSQGQALMAQNDAAAVARATQEIQAALVIAQRVPRDEIRVKARILEACKRKDLAVVAEYEYSRGGTRITGPTIDLLRAIANRWGNIRFGWTETERRDGQSMVRCFAWDMQTNSNAERTFTVKHWRDTQSGGYALKDERDIYELLANMAARRVRACLEEVIDADVVNAAIDQCRMTMKHGETESLKDRAVKMVVAYVEFGVTQAMVETRLGNKLEAISENQLASLRRVYKSLKDGVGVVADYFKPETKAPDFTPPAPAVAGGGAQQPSSSASQGQGQAPASPQPQPAVPPATMPGEDPSETQAQPAPAQTAAPPAKDVSPLALLRSGLSTHKIKEGILLDFWAKTGASDGSFGSLEEVQMSRPILINDTIAKWVEVLPKLVEAKEALKKK